MGRAADMDRDRAGRGTGVAGSSGQASNEIHNWYQASLAALDDASARV
jgi:hypothetical protein